MKFRTQRAIEPEINLIAFIDVLLVILIFLMLSSTYNKYTEVQLNLPSANTDVQKEHPQEIMVSVTSDGQFAVNKQPLPQRGVKALTQALSQAAVGMDKPMLVISAAAEILPGVDVIMSLSLSRLLEQPIIFLGGLDLLFAFSIYLGAVEIYPLIRVRAAGGVGLFGLIFFLQGHYGLMLAAIAGSIGLYLTTVLVAPKRAQISYVTGLIGLGCVAWHFISN